MLTSILASSAGELFPHVAKTAPRRPHISAAGVIVSGNMPYGKADTAVIAESTESTMISNRGPTDGVYSYSAIMWLGQITCWGMTLSGGKSGVMSCCQLAAHCSQDIDRHHVA